MTGSNTGKKRGSPDFGNAGRGQVLHACAPLRRGGSPLKSLLRRAAQPIVRLHHYRELRERALGRALCKQALARREACVPGVKR